MAAGPLCLRHRPPGLEMGDIFHVGPTGQDAPDVSQTVMAATEVIAA